MREIKFRAWEKHAKRMAEVTTFKWQPDHLYHQVYTRAIVNEKMIDEWYAYVFGGNSNGIILMQYTGLKDKNGKEIYEGDITQDVDTGKTFEIMYQGHMFMRYERKPMHMFYTLDGDCLEVIGNIYEIPELIGERHED